MGYSYDYGYGYAGPDEAMMEEMMLEMMSGFGMAFLGILVLILLAALAVAVVTYVFRSIGIYTIAKRRGIRNAWLAWIPVGVSWIEGSISDQYQYVVKGKIRNKRTVMLILSIVSVVLNVVVQIVSNVAMVSMYMEGTFDGGAAIGWILPLIGSGLNIAVLVFHFMAMYDLYTSCSPQNNVLFLVLSILFRITEPFFLFFNRNKDDGMPPRREEPRVCIPEPVQEPRETDHL